MRTLSKSQFRLLLLIYCAFLVAGFFRMPRHGKPLTRADVAEAKRSFGMEHLTDLQVVDSMLCLLGALLASFLTGVLSLFLLWRPGVYIFLLSVCARMVFEYIKGEAFRRGWWYGGLEFLFELAIVALVFFGPAKHLFQRRREV